MHTQALEYISKTLRRLFVLPPRGVVEFGSRGDFPIRDLLPRGVPYIGIDIAPGPSVDIVADAASYSPPFACDLVVCAEVFEHTAQAADIVVNAARVLKAPRFAPATLILTTACKPRPAHSWLGGPLPKGEFYQDVEPGLLASWLDAAHFTESHVEWYRDRGDIYAWARV